MCVMFQIVKWVSLVSYVVVFPAPSAISLSNVCFLVCLRFPLHNLALSCPHVSPATLGIVSQMIGEIWWC